MENKKLSQKINPFLGSWEYLHEKEYSPKRIERLRAGLEAGALLLAPGGFTYIAKKAGEELEEKKRKRILYLAEIESAELAHKIIIGLDFLKIGLAGLASYCTTL